MGWLETLGLRKAATPSAASVAAVATEAAAAMVVAREATAHQAQTNEPFSPGSPISPFAGIGGQARAWNVPAGYNIKARPTRDSRMSFESLKALTDAYDVAGFCITHRINDIRSLPWNIVPADGLDSNVENSVAIATRHMKKPDGQRSFRTWVSMYLQDVLRYDAGTLFKRRDRLGRVCALEVISGTTIAPVLDYWGRRPMGDSAAFVQWVNGQSWKWFKAGDLIYEPFNPQADSPYGVAPLEGVIFAVNTDIRFQQHFLNYFTAGNIPEGFAIMPEDASSPEQLSEFQQVLDAWAVGNDAAKHQLRAMPAGTSFQWSKDTVFDETFPMFLMRKVCAAFHVTPNDLGFTENVNKASGETQVDVQFRTGTLPLVQHLESIITDYLQNDLGLPVEFKFDTGQESEDRVETAKADEIHIRNGVLSVDEVREMRFGKATDAERPTPRFMVVQGQGIVPLREILAVGGAIDADTAAPSEAAPLDTARGITAGTIPFKFRGGTEYEEAPIFPDEPTRPALEQAVPGSDVEIKSAPVPGPAAVTKSTGPAVAGAAIKATDTGRVLMIQRTLDPGDPAAGRWEFPGGHLNPGELPAPAAIREWQEETGLEWPADAEFSTSWLTPDGVYAGLVYKIKAEASIPINTGNGEDGETLAWFDPTHLDGFPALREELATDLPVEALTKGLRKELGQWRSNTVSRIRRGQPVRRYKGAEHLPGPAVDLIYDRLTKAKDEQDAHSVFDTALTAAGVSLSPKALPAPSWRDAPPVATPQTEVDLQLTDYYAPGVQRALVGLMDEETARHIIAAHAANPIVNSVENALANGVDPTDLGAVLTMLQQDAFNVGTMAARVQLGADVPGWAGWAPGLPEPLASPLEWQAVLAQQQVTIDGVTQTTLDRMGAFIVDGLAKGLSVDGLAKDLMGVLGDANRAEMIAHTESARMLMAAADYSYRQSGVTQWDWITSAGACPICLDEESRNPHNTGASMPPGHPRCRCSASPVSTTITNPYTLQGAAA